MKLLIIGGTRFLGRHQLCLKSRKSFLDRRLIGVRIYYIDHSSNTSTDTDINLLTGLVIEKKQKGERRPLIKKRNVKFALHLLKDFDFLNGFGIEELGEHF